MDERGQQRMSIVKTLVDKMDVRAVLEELNFQHIKPSGSQLRACCALHGGDNPTSFTINKRTGYFFCHTNCGGGDIYDCIMGVLECNFADAVRWLADLQGVTVDWDNEEIDENYFRDEAMKFMESMTSKKVPKILPSFDTSKYTFSGVSEYRGYSQETINHWGLRYCENADLEGRIVMPIEDYDKRIVGVTGRATRDDHTSKFLHRPRNLHTGSVLTGLGRNLEWIQEKSECIVIEGIFDCAKFWDSGIKNVACPIGTFFTDQYIMQLIKAGVTSVVLAFDNDGAGRNGIRKAIKKALPFFDLYCIAFDEGKDADETEPDRLHELYNNKLTWYEWVDLYSETLEEVKKK